MRDWQEWIRWSGCGLGIIALFLPALFVTTPLAPPAGWSAWRLAATAARQRFGDGQNDETSPAQLVREAERLRARWLQITGHPVAKRMPAVFKAAIALPAAVALAGLCAVILLIAQWRRWRVATLALAAAGLIATGYIALIAPLLTRALQMEIASAVERAHFNALRAIAAGLAGQVALLPGIAVYLFLAAFAAMLLMPPASRAAHRPDKP